MSLRLINVLVPVAAVASLREKLKDGDMVEFWTHAPVDDCCMAGMVVRTEATESILDALEQQFGTRPDFRVVLLPVETTLPRIAEPRSDDVRPAANGAGPAAAAPPPAMRISREELVDDLAGGTRLSWVFVVTVPLAALVAAIGLVRDDVAVLIGAMVIAPLLTPNAALALATTLGDLEFGRRAFVTNVVGLILALSLSIAVGLFAEIDATSTEIAARTHVGLGDVGLALAAGAAGALAYTAGVASGLIGVMVAVALVPPLVAAGLLCGAGYFALSGAALLLVITNVICVNLAGVVTFLVQGIRPRSWWEAERAKRATRIAVGMWTVLLLVLVVVIIIAQETD